MPQMAPLMWTPLMIMFLFTLMMFMIIIFFKTNSTMMSIPKSKKKENIMNWKW